MNLNRRTFIKIGSLAAANLGALPISSLAGSATTRPTRLLQGFMSPPDEVKSSCYWWWFNGLVDKEGITRDLEEFRAKGMGEVLLVNSAGGLGGVPFPQGAKLFSDEWKVLYRHAMAEAKRLGIAVGINLSSGWCMGGPWITPENSGRWYLQSQLDVRGPQKFSGKLPLPGNRDGYDKVFNPPGYKDYIDLPLEKLDYRDTAVVAFLNPDQHASRITGERAKVLDAKTNRRDASNFALAVNVMNPTRTPWQNDPDDRPVPLNKVVDLTSKVNSEGYLDWDVPEGNWTIIRTGHRMTGSRLMIAQPEVDGLSIDWFDRKGVEIQFENFGKIVLKEAAKAGAKPKYFCDDSFEDGFPNWTGRILEKFREYRGYDATPYLPVLRGYLIESAEISDRFLTDYRKTIADCMADEHYKRFAELCHENGLLVQNEAAGPSRSGTICLDGLKNLGRSDMPMGEFWLGPDHEDQSTLTDDQSYGVSRLDFGQNKVTKMVASAAHLYGKKTASAEAFTTMRHWMDYPGSLKQALDRAYCEGINRIAIHTSTATRPRDGKPGYEYGAGTHFNPNVTWWEMSGPFFDYVARCQHLLRSGVFVADVLYYNGDAAPNLVEQKQIKPELGKGYDYDVCNEEVLLTRLSVKDNLLVLPDGMCYRLLVLPQLKRMPLPVLQKIRDLVKDGATVIGPRPLTDSGLKNYPQCDHEIETITGELWASVDGKEVIMNRFGKGRVFHGEIVRNVLAQDQVRPDFEYSGNNVWIDFIHRSAPEAEIYFVTNRKKQQAKATCLFRVKGRQPEIWDAVSGKIICPLFNEENGRTSIPLHFDVFQSVFVIFPRKAGKSAPDHQAWLWQDPFRLKPIQKIGGPWIVKFDAAWGGPEEVRFDRLNDWSAHPDERIRHYSGKALYITSFDQPLRPGKTKNLFLDLGIVKNIARVRLNGKDLGIVWTAPWRVDIADAVKEGKNKLEIEVINLWPNRLIGDATLPPEKRLTNTNIIFKRDATLLSSGLLGPVVMVCPGES